MRGITEMYVYLWVCVCVCKGSTEGDFRDTTPLPDYKTRTQGLILNSEPMCV